MPFLVRTSIKESNIEGAGNGRFFEQDCKKCTLVRKQEIGSNELKVFNCKEDLEGYDIKHLQYFCHSAPIDTSYNCIFLNEPPFYTNHSNDPNVCNVYDSKYKYTYTTRDVLKGEEMYHSYAEYKLIDWYEEFIKENNKQSVASLGRVLSNDNINK